MPLLLLPLLLLLTLCLGGVRGQRAEGSLVQTTKISCRPASNIPELVKMGKNGCITLKRTLPDSETVVHVCKSNQSYFPHDDLGTVLLRVTPGNDLRVDLYLVHCPCAGEECSRRPDPAKIKFVCNYDFAPRQDGAEIVSEFTEPANVADMELSPSVCCKDGQCPRDGAGNSSAFLNPKPSGDDDDNGKERLHVVIAVLVTFLVIALLACAYLFWKNRQLQGSEPGTSAPRGGARESDPMDTFSV